MTSAAFFLVRATIANVFRRGVRRLREPRYVAGAIVALMYFYWFAFRHDAVQRASPLRRAGANEMLLLFVTCLAFVIIVGAWALTKNTPGLVFSEAEIQFFFAGPVNRRQLIAYKFVRSQLRGLFSAFMFSVFVFRGAHFLGCWVAFIALDVYTTFVAFARARLKLANIGWLWRIAVVTLVAVATFFVAERQFRARWFDVTAAANTKQQVAAAISSIAAEPPLGVILTIPRLFGVALYSPSIASAASAIGLLLLFSLFFYVMTVLLDVSFEDESLIASQRSLTRQAQFRRGQRSATAMNRVVVPFGLFERGPASMAIVWKNIVGTLRMSSFPAVVAMAVGAFAVGAVIFRANEAVVATIGGIGLALSGLFVLSGPMALRSDMRVDILRLDVVKTFPLSAEELLASEMAGPLGIIALLELLMITTSVVILNYTPMATAFFVSPEFVVSALVFVVPICAIQLLIHNGAVILFPAWSTSGEETRGFSSIGQRLLMMIGNLATLTLALIPAGLIFVPSAWLMMKLLGKSPFAILVATIPAAAVLIVEIILALKMLASQFENLDVANDV